MPASVPVDPAIPWHQRLEAHVAMSVMAIAGASLITLLAATSQIVSRHSVARSNADVVAALGAFNRLVDGRTQFAAKQTSLIVELPVFRATLTTALDEATLTETVKDYRGKLDAAFCVVTHRDGAWAGHSGIPEEPGWRAALAPIVAVSAAGRSAHQIVSMNNELFLVVSEPARFAEEILGTMTTGFPLDDQVASELAGVTHGDVSFVCGNRLCGSSLAADVRTELNAILQTRRADLGAINGSPALHQIGTNRYVGGVYALIAADPGGPQLVLLQDWNPTAQTLRSIRLVLAAVGAGTFIIALAAAAIFSRRMTRPLRELASTANQIASGHWSKVMPVHRSAEARTMAEAFNHMTITLAHWHAQADQRAHDLAAANEQFRSVTDSVNDAIVSISTSGTIVFWNRHAEAILGYAERDTIGQELILLVRHQDRAQYGEALAALTSGDGRWLGRTFEVHARRRDGVEVPIELSLSMWRTASERFYTGVMRDITERRQAAEALRLHEEQSRHAQKMEAVGRLAGGVAHDFNNLLTAILGYADLLLERLDEVHPMRKPIVEIQKAGRSAASLTRDLLAFSRKQKRQPVVLDLNMVITDAENLLRRLIGEDVDLVIALEPGLRPVMADAGQLQQVLVNLVVNARDAMPTGGKLTMTTADLAVPDPDLHPALFERGGPYVLLRVTDTGVGISDDVRSQIFEPFFTTKGPGHGTGLGLATVYGIVKQNDGHIWVDSAPARGTTFTICLPASASAAAWTMPTEQPDVQYRGSETVLLVEDNQAVRAMAWEALERYGYKVIAAVNGQEALQAVRAVVDDISIVLTDVSMPVMGGRELAARLRVLRPDLKVVFTSGHASDPEATVGPIDTENAFLQKPFTPALLGRVIRDVLDGPVPARLPGQAR